MAARQRDIGSDVAIEIRTCFGRIEYTKASSHSLRKQDWVPGSFGLIDIVKELVPYAETWMNIPQRTVMSQFPTLAAPWLN